MLKAHNSKTANIIKGFNKYQALRERAKSEGVPFEQLQAEADDTAPAKKKRKVMKKKKKATQDFGVEIMVKDSEGKVAQYADQQVEEPTAEATEEPQQEEPPAPEVIEADLDSKIEAEETLQMIKAALKTKKKKAAKKGKKLVIKGGEVPDSIKRFFNDYGESPHL